VQIIDLTEKKKERMSSLLPSEVMVGDLITVIFPKRRFTGIVQEVDVTRNRLVLREADGILYTSFDSCVGVELERGSMKRRLRSHA
jgi:hypothetical protein